MARVAGGQDRQHRVERMCSRPARGARRRRGGVQDEQLCSGVAGECVDGAVVVGRGDDHDVVQRRQAGFPLCALCLGQVDQVDQRRGRDAEIAQRAADAAGVSCQPFLRRREFVLGLRARRDQVEVACLGLHQALVGVRRSVPGVLRSCRAGDRHSRDELRQFGIEAGKPCAGLGTASHCLDVGGLSAVLGLSGVPFASGRHSRDIAAPYAVVLGETTPLQASRSPTTESAQQA